MNKTDHRIQVSREVAREAARRIMILSDDDVPDDFLLQCQSWRQLSAEHEEAWCRAINLQQKMGLLPAALVRTSLQRPDPAAPVRPVSDPERRRHISMLVGLIVAGPAAGLLLPSQLRQWGQSQWYGITSDYRTRPGQQQRIELPEGSVLQLNTDTAVSIEYSSEQRVIILHEGEIHLSSAHDPRHRPLSVRTPHGVLTALGTRFIVRYLPEESMTALAVEEGAVAVDMDQTVLRSDTTIGSVSENSRTAADDHRKKTTDENHKDRKGQHIVAYAGQSVRFNQVSAEPVRSDLAGLDQWQKGLLIADQLPLGELVGELARYRTGWLRCDPEVAHLKITGVFQLSNTDAILNSLPHTLPVAVVYRSPYWVTVIRQS